jgi:hypothetical protein
LTGIRNDGSGTINPGIAIDTQLVEGEGVKVSLYYFDDADGYYADKGGRLESGCVKAFVYSTEGLFPSGQKRINVNSNGRAEWPTLTKVYDEASANTITSFIVTISDL